MDRSFIEKDPRLNLKVTFKILWGFFFLSTLFWIVRFWGHLPATMDTLEYVFPEKWFNVESYQNGRIPLWNPYIACGTPHVANLQSAAFYPFFWLWNLTGLTHWFLTVSLLHGILAAAGFYLWLQSQKISSVPATFCALSFAGSALMVNYWGFPTHLASVAWVPWVFWGAVRLTNRPHLMNWALLAAFWSFQILAGYPFFTFYTALFMGVWMWARNTRSLKKHILHGSAFLAALGITACQWMPFVDYLGYLHREGWGDNLFSLRWINYLTIFQPQILGTPGTLAYKGDYPNFIFNNLYLGVVPLMFFLGSFFSAKSRDFFWKGAALFWFFWLAGMNFFPLRIFPAQWLDRVEPSKASFLFLFCVFTSLGLSLQETVDFSSKKNPLRKWAWMLGALWILDLFAVPDRIVHLVADPYQNSQVRQTAEKARQWTGEGRMISLRDPNHYYSADVHNLEDSFRETAQDLVPNTNIVWGLKSARGYLTIFTDGFQNLNRYLQKGYPYDGRVLDAAGVDLILFPNALPGFKFQSRETMGSMVFTKNAGAMGNAWEVSLVKEFPNRQEVFEALLNPKAFLENEVYTEKGTGGQAVFLPAVNRGLSGYSGPSLLDRWTAWGRELFQDETHIQNRRNSPCEASFEIASSRKGFLVFDESFSPGWHAWVDGKPKPIFRADGLWMAVLLPETGAHQIFFRYEPASFRLGLFLTLLTLAALATGLLFKRREISGVSFNFREKW